MIRIILWFLLSVSWAFAQGAVGIGISIDSDIEIIVTDTWGRMTGRDPRGTLVFYNQIPNASYGPAGVDDETVWNSFHWKLASPQDDGIYMIKLISTNTSKYSLSLDCFPLEDATRYKINVNSFLEVNKEQSYKLTYYGSDNGTRKLEKVFTNNTISQDISAAIAVTEVGNSSFGTTLMNKSIQLVGALDAGDLFKAKIYYNSLNSWIENAHTNQTTTQFVSNYAYPILREDLNYVNTLINMPQSSPIIKEP